jgi:aryl carrier-like protein
MPPAAMTGVDPTPFTQWGVLGLLGFVICVLMGVIWRLFIHQSSSQKDRDQVLMSFVDRHRGETTIAMTGIAETVSRSYDRMGTAMNRQARALDAVLDTGRVMDHVARMKREGVALTREELDAVVRSIREQDGNRRDRAE